jgi:hypothetical protein
MFARNAKLHNAGTQAFKGVSGLMPDAEEGYDDKFGPTEFGRTVESQVVRGPTPERI